MANSIWCVGRNYLEHAREMNAEIPTEPLIFLKSMSSINTSTTIILPNFSNHIEHEIEIALRLDNKLNPQYLALALDLTARDIQTKLKSKGHPWALAKSFKNSCLISPWIDFKSDSWFEKLTFQLSVNGELKQLGRTKDMIFKIPQLLNYLKNHFQLLENDIILTGTPAGVSKLKFNDHLEAEIPNELNWSVKVAKSSIGSQV
jgi:acylpyruvate hydrolase